MGLTVSSASMSLDGFIAHDDHTPGALFDWYDAGSIEVPNAGSLPPFHLTEASARYWREWHQAIGVLVVGRTLFDITHGWGGVHPIGVPVVVLTHHAPADWSPPGSEDFTFVTTGIRDAIGAAQVIAGDRVVAVAAGTVATQALAAGLLDRVNIDLVPIVLGSGRPCFDGPVELGEALTVVPATRVTHLSFAARP